jgi:3-deoxy-manno-octulosonate cytidylyltransferase (CMP-KDO synthetase)
MTRDDHQSGSDRVFEAAMKLDPDGKPMSFSTFRAIFPQSSPKPFAARCCRLPFSRRILPRLPSRLSMRREDQSKHRQGDRHPDRKGLLRALYFTRATAPYGEGPLYHHIGLYAWRRRRCSASCRSGPRRWRNANRLSSLRALEDGMRIDVAIVDSVPLGVDTPADLARARQILAAEIGAHFSKRTRSDDRFHQSHRLSGRVWRKFRHGLP